jgi:hypothetical protein
MLNMSSTQHNTRSKGYAPAKAFKTILTDRSGSMFSFCGKQYDMAEHLLHDAKKQAIETQKPTDLTFVTFDDKVEYLMRDSDLLTDDIPLRKELEAALRPRNCTRFNDTLIEQVDALVLKKNTYLNSLANIAKTLNPDVAMVLIAITDGEDNVSTASRATTREKMLEFRRNGGRAILMAANMDAEKVGTAYGFNPEKAITVHNSDEQAIEFCYRAVSNIARNMTQGIDAPFTQLQRASSQQVCYDDEDDSMEANSLFLPQLPPLTRN